MFLSWNFDDMNSLPPLMSPFNDFNDFNELYLTGSRQTFRLLLNVLFFLSFCWLIGSVFLQAGDIEAQDDLALALSRGLELDTQRSSRDSIQCSSGYSTQTNTPCCSEDTIPSQGSTLTSSLLLFNLLASYHTSRGWVHTLLISLFHSSIRLRLLLNGWRPRVWAAAVWLW